MDGNDDNEQLIETLFRNGTITVVGIVLAFSLGFLTQWAANPLPWKLIDLPPTGLIIIGIVLQIRALAALLQPHSLKRNVYDQANRRFLNGVIATGSGVILAIIIDLIVLVAPSLL